MYRQAIKGKRNQVQLYTKFAIVIELKDDQMALKAHHVLSSSGFRAFDFKQDYHHLDDHSSSN